MDVIRFYIIFANPAKDPGDPFRFHAFWRPLEVPSPHPRVHRHRHRWHWRPPAHGLRQRYTIG